MTLVCPKCGQEVNDGEAAPTVPRVSTTVIAPAATVDIR